MFERSQTEYQLSDRMKGQRGGSEVKAGPFENPVRFDW